MSKLTRSNIAYDLNISPHKMLIIYDADSLKEYSNKCEITFVFSSELYKNKFAEKLEDNRKTINQSLTNRFGITIKDNILADLKLYQSIEKRGFLIYKGLVKIECRENIILNGNRLMIES